MRAFIALIMVFLGFMLLISNSLKNVDLTPNTVEAAQAVAAPASQPVVITIQESPEVTIPNTAVMVPVTGSCADPYIVQTGDWLLKIARNCNTTLPAILQANPHILNPDRIDPGQLISMPKASVVIPVPVTGLDTRIQSGTEMQVRAIHFPPNMLVNVAVGPEAHGYIVVTSGFTDASGNLTTHITVPSTNDSLTPWVVAVVTVTEPPVQVISETFNIK